MVSPDLTTVVAKKQCNPGLFVAAGGHAILTGTCQGTATNDGGELHIEGTVTETVVEPAGTTTICCPSADRPAVTVVAALPAAAGQAPRRGGPILGPPPDPGRPGVASGPPGRSAVELSVAGAADHVGRRLPPGPIPVSATAPVA